MERFRHRTQIILLRAWESRGLLPRLLLPLAWLYGMVLKLRRPRPHSGHSSGGPVGVPVVIVGNLLVGGAGKTPVVMALVEYLRSQGWRVGVISRGYGRNGSDCREVTQSSQAEEVGDEPLLIRRQCDVPVFVCARRLEAVSDLCKAYPEVNVVLSDDGLQHLGLRRDVEILVFDDRGIGNGWLLPAGPLREPWPRRSDFVLSPVASGLHGFAMLRRLDRLARRSDGTGISLDELRQRKLIAVAGIARPEAFFKMLRDEGLSLATAISLPDHFDFSGWAVPPGDDYTLICTEKDAVKLWRFYPLAVAIPLVIELDAAFCDALNRLLHAKLSSALEDSRGPQHG